MTYREIPSTGSGSVEFGSESIETLGFDSEGFEGSEIDVAGEFSEMAFDAESFDPAPFIQEVVGSESELPADLTESQWVEFGFEEVAPGVALEQEFSSICGQLIISLPGGGALQLDWPLSVSDWTSANSVSPVEAVKVIESVDGVDSSDTLFTEVITDDFE